MRDIAAFLHGTKGVMEEMLKVTKSNGEEILKELRSNREEIVKMREEMIEMRNNGDALKDAKASLADALNEGKGMEANTDSEYDTPYVDFVLTLSVSSSTSENRHLNSN